MIEELPAPVCCWVERWRGLFLDQRHKRWAAPWVEAHGYGSTRWCLHGAAHRLGCWLCLCIQQADAFDRSTAPWINARSLLDALWCISSPRLCGAQEACQRRNDRGEPVRALRRLPQGLGPRRQEWPPWARGDRGAIGAAVACGWGRRMTWTRPALRRGRVMRVRGRCFPLFCG